MKRFWRILSNASFKFALVMVAVYFASLAGGTREMGLAAFAVMATTEIVAVVAESKVEKK